MSMVTECGEGRTQPGHVGFWVRNKKLAPGACREMVLARP